MTVRSIIITFVLLNLYCNINAQSLLKGKIYDAETDSVVAVVNVFNVKTKLSVRSGTDGSYSIAAEEGEKVVFSMTGFGPDSVTVDYSMLLTQYDVSLQRRVISLQGVTVKNSYEADSLARRNYYSYVYEKQAGITGRNRPANGVGVVVSPVSYFHHESRQKRELKKRLAREEQEDYIDHSFPVQWVEKITGLHGDSLSLFMYRYRPSYSFCRNSDREKMLEYVNDKLKEYKHPRSIVKPR